MSKAKIPIIFFTGGSFSVGKTNLRCRRRAYFIAGTRLSEPFRRWFARRNTGYPEHLTGGSFDQEENSHLRITPLQPRLWRKSLQQHTYVLTELPQNTWGRAAIPQKLRNRKLKRELALSLRPGFHNTHWSYRRLQKFCPVGNHTLFICTKICTVLLTVV